MRGYREHVQEKKRTEELRQLAEVLGFTIEGDYASLRARFGEFQVFTSPFINSGRNMMTGSLAGQLVTVMDHRTRNRSRRSKTLAFFPDGAKGLPDFQLSSVRIPKFLKAVARRHIAFSETDEFSRNFTVFGADETAIQRAFGAKTRAFFAANQGWSVETRNGAAAVFRKDNRVAPAKVWAFLADAVKVLDAFRRR